MFLQSLTKWSKGGIELHRLFEEKQPNKCLKNIAIAGKIPLKKFHIVPYHPVLNAVNLNERVIVMCRHRYALCKIISIFEQ